MKLAPFYRMDNGQPEEYETIVNVMALEAIQGLTSQASLDASMLEWGIHHATQSALQFANEKMEYAYDANCELCNRLLGEYRASFRAN